MTTTLASKRSKYRSLLAIPAVAASVVGGVWLAGGVVSNDFKTSMALTAAWFVLSGAACLLVARRARAACRRARHICDHRWCGRGLPRPDDARDGVAHERVVTATPATQTAAGEPAPAAVEVARGRFRSHQHATTGEAALVRLADGRRFLTLARG